MKLLDDLIDRADALQRHAPVLAFPLAVWKKFTDDRAGDLAALIAYYTFVAIFPLLLILVTVLDIVLRHNPDLRQHLINSALSAYPVLGPQIKNNVSPLHSTGIALAVGVAGAAVGARGIAMAMQNALNTVWAVPADRRPAFPWSMIRGVGLIAVIGIGQIVTVSLSGIAGGLGHLLTGAPAEAGTIALAFVLNIGVFWLAFRLATAAEVSWRELFLGAVLSAASWQILQLLGGFIVGRTLQRSSALYGVFGIVLGLLAWLYLQAQVTLYAAEVCTVRSWRLWPRSLRPPPTDQDRLAYERYDRADRHLPVDGARPAGLTEHMTTTTDVAGRARGASPVDFEAYGDYSGRPKSAAKQGPDADAKQGPEAGAKQAPEAGQFSRPAYPFQGRITADGSSGYPAEAGRYHLYISWACPWAHRTAIVRKLLGLEDVISLSVVDPIRDGRGWAFREGPGHGLDPVNGFAFLREAYEATEPGFDGHMSVPLLWDKRAGRIVSNNFPDITIDLDTQFGRWADPDVQLYPAELRPAIDEINQVVYTSINNGVYRSGFATTQQAYHEAVTDIFRVLDQLEERLAGRRYLVGPTLTEADVRLWVTLARFDAVYYSHFKANLRRITDYPNLWAYARDLYSRPAFRETTNFDHIKRHYYTTHGAINPTRIVPDGPLLAWDAPNTRASL